MKTQCYGLMFIFSMFVGCVLSFFYDHEKTGFILIFNFFITIFSSIGFCHIIRFIFDKNYYIFDANEKKIRLDK